MDSSEFLARAKLIYTKSINKLFDRTAYLPRNYETRKREKSIRLSYLGKFSYELRYVCRLYGFKLAYYSPTILRLLVRVKCDVPKEDENGVYTIESKDCTGIYCISVKPVRRCRLELMNTVIRTWKYKSTGISAFPEHLIFNGHRF